jgi:alkylation response protein AidB-like acyl-CoA dehydrogenase
MLPLVADPPGPAVAVRAAIDSGALDLPLPGSGGTAKRLAGLAAIAERSLDEARLAEGHLDAVAILAELDGPPPGPGEFWGVWAAEPPGAALVAEPDGPGWRLTGAKPFCSGAGCCTHALVTAAAPDGRRLFAAPQGPGLRAVPGSWPAVGMAGSDSRAVVFDGVPATAVGGVDAYLDRPGFWHGAVGVAACWFGGARGTARALLRAAGRHPLDDHQLADLGAVDAALTAMAAVLADAAAGIDADPGDRCGAAALRAARVRAVVEAGAEQVLRRTGRALGARPLCLDAEHARRVADLTVYLRQSHGDRDLAAAGRRLLDRPADW